MSIENETRFRDFLRSWFKSGSTSGYEIWATELAELEFTTAELDRLVALAILRGWLRSVDSVGSGVYRVLPGVTGKATPKKLGPRVRAVHEVLVKHGELSVSELGRLVWGENHVDDATVIRTVDRLSAAILEHDPRNHVERIGETVRLHRTP